MTTISDSTGTPILDKALNAFDRCDKCGAQAFVRAVFMTSELLFCGHHFAENEISLSSAALFIEDHRDRINAHRASSA